MGQALYRKYRSKSLGEVVGQEHITDTLKKALSSSRVSHAYLFTGPRGVGKTSIARILAHEINGIPYEDDSQHLDIIEIDAASNRRIDEIRELRNKVNTAPTSAPYKVYIIDEVHMLTKEAFNALLKTLEEPPKHVIFILATTEIHKLPETIISRTQHFTFKPVSEEKVVAHLRVIAEQEHIKITDEALALIAQHGEGSFRDSISLLDQAGSHEGEVDLSHIQSILGIPPASIMETLQAGLATHDPVTVMQTITQLHEQGYQPSQIARRLGNLWRNQLLADRAARPEDFVLLQKLLDVPAARNPERYLEIILLEFALQGTAPVQAVRTPQPVSAPPKVDPPAIQPKAPDQPKKDTAKPVAQTTTKKAAATPKEADPTPVAVAVEAPATTPVAVLDAAIWPQILAELKKKYNTLYGVVRMAQPTFEDRTLSLGFSFAFHRKRLSEAKNQQIVADIVKQLTGQAITIKCTELAGEPQAMPDAVEVVEAAAIVAPSSELPQELAAKPDIAAISNIFGGGELLES